MTSVLGVSLGSPEVGRTPVVLGEVQGRGGDEAAGWGAGSRKEQVQYTDNALERQDVGTTKSSWAEGPPPCPCHKNQPEADMPHPKQRGKCSRAQGDSLPNSLACGSQW